eukprot:1156850-Pelagomonas_calceolata.AAC.20
MAVPQQPLTHANLTDCHTSNNPAACMATVLEDLEVGAALGPSHAYHHADVLGADGRRVGRVRYGFTFRRPLDSLLREYKAQGLVADPALLFSCCAEGML